MNQLDPQALDHLASEYVLGTLSAEQRLYVQRLMRQDPTVQQRVHVWEERLNPMATAVPPVTPPAKIWHAIEQKIAIDKNPSDSEQQPSSRRWWFNVAAAAAGLLLGISLSFVSFDSKPPESYVGVLSSINSSEPVMHASALRHHNQLYIKMIKPMAIADQQVLVLWALPKNKKPLRVGVVSANDKTVIDLSAEAEIVFKDVSTLAVSVEAINATTPASYPSEFLLRGPCVKLW